MNIPKRWGRNAILLVILAVVALLLRVYKVDSIPPSLSWDEVSIGYNAYSILQTGKDEHGRFFPLDTFVAFGDYKPPVAIYLTVPFVWLFGLREISVRLPSVLSGVGSVVLTYFLVLELFPKEKRRTLLAFLASFVLCVSPWHINISRAGFEANIATTIIIFGTWHILMALRTGRALAWIWVPFVLALYTFNSARYFVPFLGVGLLFWQRKKFLANPKVTILSMSIGLILLLPILPHLFSKEARLRYSEVNIFSDVGIVRTANERIQGQGNTVIANILHNRRIGYFFAYMKHYLDHFEPSFLFIKGDGNPKFSTQDTGQLYLIELPLLVGGIILLVWRHTQTGLFLLFWLLTAIIPAGVARETPHALRILVSLPTWQLFVGFGIFQAIVSKKRIILLCIGLGYVLNISHYMHNYYQHYPYEYSGEWQYGYKEAIEYAKGVEQDYDMIVLTDFIGRPYAYTLFYTKYNPEAFLQTKDSFFDAAGFYTVNGFGKYRFITVAPETYEAKILYILPISQVPTRGRLLKTVKLLNGTPILQIFTM